MLDVSLHVYRCPHAMYQPDAAWSEARQFSTTDLENSQIIISDVVKNTPPDTATLARCTSPWKKGQGVGVVRGETNLEGQLVPCAYYGTLKSCNRYRAIVILEWFIVVSTLCFVSPAACCWCRVSCCLFLEMKTFCLLKYCQSRITQARGVQGEENQDQSMKGCSVNSER